MPRCQGLTDYDRTISAQAHRQRMGDKYCVLHGGLPDAIDVYNNYGLWFDPNPSGNFEREFPLPYDSKFYPRYFAEAILKIRNTSLYWFLENEFYGDSFDAEYIDGLLRDLEELGVCQDGAAIVMLMQPIGTIRYAPLPNGQPHSDLESIHNCSSSDVFYGSSLNTARFELARKWLKKKKKAERKGCTENRISSTKADSYYDTIFKPGFTVDNLTTLLVSIHMIEDPNSKNLTEEGRKSRYWVAVIEALRESKLVCYGNHKLISKMIFDEYEANCSERSLGNGMQAKDPKAEFMKERALSLARISTPGA